MVSCGSEEVVMKTISALRVLSVDLVPSASLSPGRVLTHFTLRGPRREGLWGLEGAQAERGEGAAGSDQCQSPDLNAGRLGPGPPSCCLVRALQCRCCPPSCPLWSQCCVCPCSLTTVTSRGPRTEDWTKQAANIYHCSSWFPLPLLVELPVKSRVHRIVTLIIFLGFLISGPCVLFLLSILFWISVFSYEIIGF